jgi:hypothetical protein
MKIKILPTIKKFRMKKSVSLIELMISLAVLSIILSLVFSVTGTGKISWYLASAKISLYSQARGTFSAISRELMLSSRSRIFIAAGGTSIRFSIPVVDTDGELVLSGGDLQWGDGEIIGNSINYTVVETDLVRQVLDAGNAVITSSSRTIARNISGFTASTDNLQYELTLTATLTNYLGKTFPNPMVYSVNTAITPQN